jgi:ABC-type multidrug transport system fused ATPase/permease subunit
VFSTLAKLRRLLIHEPRDTRNIVLLLLAMTIAAALEAAGIGMVMPFMALLQNPGLADTSTPLHWLKTTLDLHTHMEMVTATGLMLVAVFVVKNAYLALSLHLQYRFIFGRELALSRELMARYLYSPYAFHLRNNSAQLQATLGYDVSQVISHVAVSVASIAVELLTMLVVVVVLIWIEPVAVPLVGIVLGGTSAVFYRYAQRSTLTMGEYEQKHFKQALKWLNQGLGGIKETQVTAKEKYFLDGYVQHVTAYSASQSTHRTVSTLPRYLLETVGVLGLVGVCTLMLLRGSSSSAVLPTLGVIALSVVRLLPSAAKILGSVSDIRHHLPSLNSLDRALQETQRTVPAQPGPRMPLGRDVEFRGVTFTYPSAPTAALRDISFTVKKGESVALVGPSGGGKTTLVDLLVGLLEPTMGQVLVDGIEIRGERVASWRQSVGYIPQQVYLSDESVARNVAWGLEDKAIDRERVRQCLEMASLGDWLKSLSEGLDSSVGERGVRISGGQRQRIGIARALYSDPAMLILDEATSALDSRTERDIVDQIEAQRGKRTLLVVAHRLSTVRGCDRILFIREGRVAHSGTWTELYDSSEEFRELVELSFQREPIEPARLAGAATT